MDWRKSLPGQLAQPFRDMLENVPDEIAHNVREIRIRASRPVVLAGMREYFLGLKGPSTQAEAYRPDMADCRMLLETIAGHSLYAHEEEIRQGYLTLRGGFRVGLTGRAVVEDGQVRRLTQISGFSIRVAREMPGVAKRLLPHLLSAGRPLSTLILSPPGMGKTTMLRDAVRLLSDGGIQVGLADERGEVAALHKGIAQLDVGIRTDVMDGCPKRDALYMLLRSMSPQVVATDEIAIPEEVPVLRACQSAGVAVLATAHAGGWLQREGLDKFFSRMVVLGGDTPGQNVEVLDAATGGRLAAWRA